MICCLNPHCDQPLNPAAAEICESCRAPLIHRLRGRYRPLKPMGRGGFGRTYRAVDLDRLNTGCVIKQFSPQTQGTKSLDKAIQLFEQEAQRLNELGEHPQIPTLLAYFEHNQYLYLVQQVIEGPTLYQELQKNGPYSETALCTLLRELLPVLQFIHDRGIIHRDITPTNVIRRELDGKPVLIDFGVAKQFTETILYEPGTRIGTEGYAPIEQLRSGQAYPSSDLYSLGASCLHLLTGCKPEVLYSPLEGRWLWRESLQQSKRSINPLLGQLLERMVQDLISERFQNVQEVLTELERIESANRAVPGWISQHSGSSLFSDPAMLPLAPETPIPPTVPPAGPPVSAPQVSRGPLASSGPRTGRRSSSGPGWRCVAELKGHTSWITTIAFNPKTPTLVSGSLDDTIRVWSLQTGKVLYTLQGHPRGVNQVAIGSGGQVLASCGDDGLVKVWNLADGSLLHTLEGHMRDVTSVAIHPQGFWLASGSEDCTIKLWKLDKGSLVRSLSSPGMVRSVIWLPQQDMLVSGGLDNQLRLWDLPSGQMTQAISGHVNSVNQVAVSGDGQRLVSASKDRSVRVWDAAGTLLQTLSGHSQEVNAVAIAPDHHTVISGSSDGKLRIWDSRTGTLRHTLSHGQAVQSLGIYRNGRILASAGADQRIRLWKWVK